MTDLERTVRQAIARIRELPPDTLTITEINVVEMLEAAVAKPAATPDPERLTDAEWLAIHGSGGYVATD